MTVVDAEAVGTWTLAGEGGAFTPSAAAEGGWRVVGVGEASVGEAVEELYEDPEVIVPAPGGSVEPPEPPLPPLPPDYASMPLRHVWQRLGAPVLGPDGLDHDWMPSVDDHGEYGRLQIVVEGVDVTYFLGAETPEMDWSETDPFGWGPGTLRLPQLTVFHATPPWARNGANVIQRLVPVPGSALKEPVTLYQGIVTRVGDRQEGGVFTLDCTGLLYAADLQMRKPAFTTAPQDIGTAIPRVLNAVISRRYWAMEHKVTGIRTSVLGGWEPTLTGYLANILATAVDKQRQWTVMLDGRRPVLVHKNTTSTDFTVRYGQAGVKIDLGSDAAEARNAIYGEGINPDGGRWRNAHYPNWRPDDTPAFPNANPNRTIRIGTRDSDTDTGRGVSDFKRKAGMRVTSVFTAADAAEVKRLQRAMGIQDDGIVGSQTWAATFKTGSNTGTFDGAFIAPLAVATEVEPRLYGPDGDDLGPNPKYNSNILRVELPKIDYGQGVTKAEGKRNAREVLAREVDPGFAGTITFDRVDPEQMHRYQLRAGMNGMVRGHRGQDVRVHVVAMSKRGQTVTLTVDSKARDYPTLKALLERDKQATDPARTARTRLLQGQVASDRPVYDAESHAGIIPRHSIHRGLWNVLRIPAGDYGRFVRSEFRTTRPIQGFAVAVFGKPVTANQLVARIGNPLLVDDAWDKDLSDLGLLQSWGDKAQPAGYWPGFYAKSDGETGKPATGRLVDDTSWDFASQQSPWLWVGIIALQTGYIEGRLYGAADW